MVEHGRIDIVDLEDDPEAIDFDHGAIMLAVGIVVRCEVVELRAARAEVVRSVIGIGVVAIAVLCAFLSQPQLHCTVTKAPRPKLDFWGA